VPEYTAISFAPVQGFIEKSRKLRDLFGASLILSYLSQKIVQEIEQSPGLQVISPAQISVQEGMPNRILVKGFINRDRVKNILLKHWQELLKVCREWVEDNLGIPKDQYYWAQTKEQVGKQKGEWERWGSYAWEVFWGSGDSPQAAMDDLETRKLKRDWTGINWIGESSSLSGTDAIAWNRLGLQYKPGECQPGRSLTDEEQQELELFYRRLSWLLDNPDERLRKPHLSLTELREYEKSNPDGIGKYIAVNERLSVPELVKRLITYDKIDCDKPDDEKLGIEKLKKKPEDPEFKDINREAGYWTGWFMGDGDKVGDKLKTLAERNPDHPSQRDKDLNRFSELMREWGGDFKDRKDLFPQGKGRVIYAGGDDFLGVLYSEEPEGEQAKPEKVKPIEAWNWLLKLPEQWKDLQETLAQELNLTEEHRFTYSVGFVWAGHQVPQRDILQHCREAEKRSKNLKRDRLTIRVVFNSGQYVQWTCPWDYLDILTKYRDRDRKTGKDANWTHLYSDWSQLKARHAIPLQDHSEQVDDRIALKIFELYFDDMERFEEHSQQIFKKSYTPKAVIEWLDGLVNVGWQLCSNT